MALSKEIWEQIEKEFVFGVVDNDQLLYPSYGYLSEKHSISKPVIFRRAKSRGWEIKRESYRNQTAEKVVTKKSNGTPKEGNENRTVTQKENITQEDINKKADETSEIILNFDVKCSKISNSIINLVDENIKRIEKKMKADPQTMIEPKLIGDNAKALETAQSAFKKAIGIPTGINVQGKIDLNINELDESIDDFEQKTH